MYSARLGFVLLKATTDQWLVNLEATFEFLRREASNIMVQDGDMAGMSHILTRKAQELKAELHGRQWSVFLTRVADVEQKLISSLRVISIDAKTDISFKKNATQSLKSVVLLVDKKVESSLPKSVPGHLLLLSSLVQAL